MRILLVNYRYFISGGPEKYMFNIKTMLENQGHEVIPFLYIQIKMLQQNIQNILLNRLAAGMQFISRK